MKNEREAFSFPVAEETRPTRHEIISDYGKRISGKNGGRQELRYDTYAHHRLFQISDCTRMSIGMQKAHGIEMHR